MTGIRSSSTAAPEGLVFSTSAPVIEGEVVA